LANDKTVEALADLDVVAAAVAKQSELRMDLGDLYLRARVPAKAAEQFDLWLLTHSRDADKYEALHSACWAKALADRDLKGALEDCDAVLAAATRSAPLLDSRGLVWLRMGRFDKAIADYDAALALSPKQAWSLYGRGVARLKAGQAAAGKADIAAAVALQPGLAEEARGYGIGPGD
jgi:tetratricopeptide (TPR) repeat protein